MKAYKWGLMLVLSWAVACTSSGPCKVGEDDSCGVDAFCYAGPNQKVGDKGICTHKEAVLAGELIGEPAVEVPTELVVSGFSPFRASHGEELRVWGKGFSVDPSQNIVTLNGVEAEVLFAGPEEMVVKVPQNLNCSGLLRVSSQGQTASSLTSFFYVPKVTVSTVAGSGEKGFANGVGEAAKFNWPSGLAIGKDGTLYVADSSNHRIRAISPQGVVSTFAGSGTPDVADGAAARAMFYSPQGLLMDSDGTLYVADSLNHRIRTISPQGVVSTLAGYAPPPPLSERLVYFDFERGAFVDGQGNLARFHKPVGMAIDAQKNLYVADALNHLIRQVTPQGNVSAFAGTYKLVHGFLADGERLAGAYFDEPMDIAIDATGRFFVADMWNHSIRVISPNGFVSTFAGSRTSGVADGRGNQAEFYQPSAIAIDAADNLYVADRGSHRIRKVTPQRVVSTIAGSAIAKAGGYADGPGNLAMFNSPGGLAIDADGNLYVADSGNHRIRKIVFE